MLYVIAYCAVALFVGGVMIYFSAEADDGELKGDEIAACLAAGMFWPVVGPVIATLAVAMSAGEKARDRRKAKEKQEREVEETLKKEGLA